ncbi:toll/interleukin-1 receptor domain-containing protein [Clostridium beijerinckii]|uniref:toll/interleukin-1 receptor domain-containing protein n=1 Tax=Clostridium beijerinckii TaxID=1520 RepID=UPI00098C9AFA|nr:toll/interleukin-1 receptor domain-containing protein [Clostridium beijerinckii]NRT77622.1 hypothetical protein [Clostridium beijerinckii]OOM50476.1 TIR domain protein [Clostridium beijerinckii]
MKVFISYSRKDKKFAHKLSRLLTKNKIFYFIDNSEITVGNGLSTKIENGLNEATHFIALMSKNYFKSNWCKKELSYALKKQEDEKREIIIPILIEECILPQSISDIFYINAVQGLENSYAEILEVINRLSNDNVGKSYESNYIIDWGVEWGMLKGGPSESSFFYLNIDGVFWEKNKEYSIITKISVRGLSNLVYKYVRYKNQNEDYKLRNEIYTILSLLLKKEPDIFKIILDDDYSKTRNVYIDSSVGEFDVSLFARRLGPDPGNDILFYYDNLIEQLGNIAGETDEKMYYINKIEVD